MTTATKPTNHTATGGLKAGSLFIKKVPRAWTVYRQDADGLHEVATFPGASQYSAINFCRGVFAAHGGDPMAFVPQYICTGPRGTVA